MVLDRAGAAGGGATEHTCSPRVPGAEGTEGEVAVGLAHGVKVLWILIDGIGDVSLESLGRRTPLQTAKTPACDAIACSGVSGMMDPVQAGLACGSDTSHLSMFGYDPRRYYRGRGAFETMGTGLEMLPGDIAFKCNFATLDRGSGVVTSRRADRNFEHDGPILCKALTGIKVKGFEEYEITLKYATEHRCGLRVRGPDLSDNITGTDPLKDRLPLQSSKPLDGSHEAAQTSKLINTLSKSISDFLEGHEVNRRRTAEGKAVANVVLLRGCGARIRVPTFNKVHGIRPFMIAPTCLIRGLGISLDMRIVEAPGATGDYNTDLGSKARAAISAFESGEFDLGFLHVKAVDDAGHDKSCPLKLQFLEKIDSMMESVARGLLELGQRTRVRYVMCVTGDHSTPVEYGDHSAEPVPFTISSVDALIKCLDCGKNRSCGGAEGKGEGAGGEEGFLCDAVDRFDEVSAVRGALGRFPGCEVMGIIKRFSSIYARGAPNGG